ncbi:MAG: type I-E CRISPR-associated protein Cse2/CasB [Fimbriimonadaceae bacterium]|nr:type I-E CRISPR-associated protein Cse2/CasB [Fimbriimonadaceae bacterium]MBX3649331.1 type I-E CRISPR-associated protein Cse2/CasB [Rhodocyclaceae bacterium]
MRRFIEWLEGLNQKDTKVRALLRRSLAFDPGAFPPAYPYVEPFVQNESDEWKREMHYLVAGLWAAHSREGHAAVPTTIGKACAAYQAASGSTSTERRFITLLDSSSDELPHRLRQVIALLKDYSIDFEALLTGLVYWNDGQKRTQNSWARDFYRNLQGDTGTEAESVTEEEQPA